MQEQNFEEEVRRKMAELSFTPSDPVWEKVEKEIRRKKERRRIFFWLLPLLLIPGFAYYIMNGIDSTVSIVPAAPSIDKQFPSKSRQGKPATQLPTVDNGSAITSTTQRSINHPALLNSKSRVPSVTSENNNNNHDDDHGVATRTGSKNNNVGKTGVDETLEKNGVTGTDDLRQQTIDKQPADGSAELKGVIDAPTGEADSARIGKAPADSLLVPLADTASAREIVQLKKHAKKRWKVSLNSSLGIAGVSTSALPSFNGGKSGVYQNLAFDNGPGTSASTNAPRSNLRSVVLQDEPSKVRRNIAFSAGIRLNKEIKTRVGLSTGLQYTQISTLTSVGRKVQSAASQPSDFYLNTSLATKDYITRYHVLELPLSFNWQVMPKTPLKLHAGTSLGYLLSTNALQYDGEMNIYYLDKSLYKPMLLSALTGFEYTVTKKSKHALSIGPRLQFQLSNLLRNKTYGQQHLYFAGIGTSFSF